MRTKPHFTGKILAFIRTKMRTKTSRHVYQLEECGKRDRRRGRGENVGRSDRPFLTFTFPFWGCEKIAFVYLDLPLFTLISP